MLSYVWIFACAVCVSQGFCTQECLALWCFRWTSGWLGGWVWVGVGVGGAVLQLVIFAVTGVMYWPLAFSPQFIFKQQRPLSLTELVAAVLVVRVDVQIIKELDFTLGDRHLWAYSAFVLGYVKMKGRVKHLCFQQVGCGSKKKFLLNTIACCLVLNLGDEVSIGLGGEVKAFHQWRMWHWKNGFRLLCQTKCGQLSWIVIALILISKWSYRWVNARKA